MENKNDLKILMNNRTKIDISRNTKLDSDKPSKSENKSSVLKSLNESISSLPIIIIAFFHNIIQDCSRMLYLRLFLFYNPYPLFF